MTPLRQQMLDAMVVRGLAVRTQETYVDSLGRMARYFGRSPAVLSAQEIEAYMLYLVKDRKLSFSSVNHVAAASRFLFTHVLAQPETGERMLPPVARTRQKQPELLSREQIARLFDLHTICRLLGHGHIETTSRYLHLISPQFKPPRSADPLDLLAGLPTLKPH